MAIAVLVFDLDKPEDEAAHKRAINATNAYLVLHDFYNNSLRKRWKYADLPEDKHDLVMEINGEFCEMLNAYDIDMNDLE